MNLGPLVDRLSGRTVVLLTTVMSVGIAVSVKSITEGDMTLWNQIQFRNIIAVVWALLLIRPRLATLGQLKSKTMAFVAFRCMCYVSAIYTFTLALEATSVANVDFVGSFPFIAVIGWFIYKETVRLPDVVVLVVAVLGLVLLSGATFADLSVGRGEFFAFVSAGLFSVTWLLSRNLSEAFTPQEYAAVTQTLTAPLIFCLLMLIDGPSTFAVGISIEDILWSISAGFFITANITLISSGARRVSGVELSVLTSLASVLAVVASIVFFSDWPSVREILGGVLVVGSAILFAVIEQQRTSRKEAAAA